MLFNANNVDPNQMPRSFQGRWGINGLMSFIFEPAHDKTYNKTCVTSADSNKYTQYAILDSPKAVEGASDKRSL